MKQQHMKFYISICVLILSGFYALCAHNYEGLAFSETASVAGARAFDTEQLLLHGSNEVITSPTSGTHHENGGREAINVEEEVETELQYLKGNADHLDGFAIPFPIPLQLHYFCFSEKWTQNRTHSSEITAYRPLYIVNRILRI